MRPYRSGIILPTMYRNTHPIVAETYRSNPRNCTWTFRICHRQRLSKPFVSFSHCPRLFCILRKHLSTVAKWCTLFSDWTCPTTSLLHISCCYWRSSRRFYHNVTVPRVWNKLFSSPAKCQQQYIVVRTLPWTQKYKSPVKFRSNLINKALLIKNKWKDSVLCNYYLKCFQKHILVHCCCTLRLFVASWPPYCYLSQNRQTINKTTYLAVCHPQQELELKCEPNASSFLLSK